MHFIERSLSIAYELLPAKYMQEKRAISGWKAIHFAFAYRRNTLLAMGQNSYKEDGRIVKFKRFAPAMKFNFPHAELDCLARLWGRERIDSTIRLVVIRLNRNGMLCDSKPCPNCRSVLNALCLTDVYASTKYGEIVKV